MVDEGKPDHFLEIALLERTGIDPEISLRRRIDPAGRRFDIDVPSTIIIAEVDVARRGDDLEFEIETLGQAKIEDRRKTGFLRKRSMNN